MKNDFIVQQDFSEIVKSLGNSAYKFEGTTVLITGGSGFLGQYIVGVLCYLNQDVLEKPCKIISIDNYITSSKKNDQKITNVHHIEHDVQKPFKIPGKVDYIIHAAGIASPVYYKKYPLEAIDVAVNGTRNMLDLTKFKNARSVLFFSSSEIYGDPSPDAIPTKETYFGNVSSIGPRSVYDESKRLGETLCITYYDLFKLPVKIVRPFNVYGPGMRANDYRVIPAFIFNALSGKPIPIHSNGLQTRAFCYISDAVAGFFKVLLSGGDGQVYNVGNDLTEVTMESLAEILNHIFDNKLSIQKVTYPLDYPQGDPKRRCPDLSKMRVDLGFDPQIDLQKGLLRTLEWCKVNWKIK